jgi:hypothetical protein
LIERQENDDPRLNAIALAAEQLKLNYQGMSAEKVFETENPGNIMHRFPANATALESQKHAPQSKTQSQKSVLANDSGFPAPHTFIFSLFKYFSECR